MMTDEQAIKREGFRLGGYATGNYTDMCILCGSQFIGDKRAINCLECAARYASELIDKLHIQIANLEETMALTALKSAGFQHFSKGSVVVPEKPTYKMIEASNKAMKIFIETLPNEIRKNFRVGQNKKAEIRYRAMIEAAKGGE